MEENTAERPLRVWLYRLAMVVIAASLAFNGYMFGLSRATHHNTAPSINVVTTHNDDGSWTVKFLIWDFDEEAPALMDFATDLTSHWGEVEFVGTTTNQLGDRVDEYRVSSLAGLQFAVEDGDGGKADVWVSIYQDGAFFAGIDYDGPVRIFG